MVSPRGPRGNLYARSSPDTMMLYGVFGRCRRRGGIAGRRWGDKQRHQSGEMRGIKGLRLLEAIQLCGFRAPQRPRANLMELDE